MSTMPRALLLTVTVSKPAIVALAGFVPWALSGISTFVRFCASVAEIRRRDQQRRQLAVRPGGRLQRGRRRARRSPRDIPAARTASAACPAASLRLIGMQVRQARQRGEPLVPLRVVLHRARAERIEVRVDRHVPRREIDEMAHEVDLADFRQRRRRRGERRRRQQLLRSATGTSAGGNRCDRRTRLRSVRTELCSPGFIVFSSHESFNRN